jgi:hypothetical protein
MSKDKAVLNYYAYKCSHPVATIHWAACPHCMHGMGQRVSYPWPKHKKFNDDGYARGWTPLTGYLEDDVIRLAKSGQYRFCGYCCADLRDVGKRRA